MTNCTNCGSSLRPGAKFCPICGTKQPTAPVPPRPLPARTSGGAGPLVTAVLVDPQQNQFPVRDQMSMGRAPDNVLHVDVDDVSRHHAVIVWQLTTWVVMDLNSSNGTFVNEQQVLGSAPLRHGDRLRLGMTAQFLFVDPTQAGGVAPSGSLPATRQMDPHTATQPPDTGGSAPTPVLKNWKGKRPQVEGHILSVRGPYTVEKDGKVGRALLSVGLGLINPALAFIPFAVGKNQLTVTHLRVQRIPDQQHVAVTLIGDQTSILESGDLVAVWGKDQEGVLFAQAIYNYQTDALIRFK